MSTGKFLEHQAKRQGMHPRPVKQKQAQVHVPYSTRHDKLDECINQTRTPSACHHRRQHHSKKRHHAAPTKPTQESKSGMGATRYYYQQKCILFSRQRHGSGMKQMRLHHHATAIVCGSYASTKKPCRTKPRRRLFHCHTPP